MYASNSSVPATDWRNFRVTANPEKAGIEIRFPDQPPLEIREQLGKKRGQGFGFTKSNNDDRWYAADTPGRWIWLRQFAAQYAPYGAILDDTPQDSPPTPHAGSSSETRYRRRHRGGSKRTDQAPTNNITPIRPPLPTPHASRPTPSPATNMKHLDALSALLGDPDELLAWAEQLIANDWRTGLKQLATSRNPDAIAAPLVAAQVKADIVYTMSLIQLALLRCTLALPSQQATPAPVPLPPIATAPLPEPKPVQEVVEADPAKKALRGKPRVVFLAPKRPALPSAPITPPVTATPKIGSEPTTTSRIGQTKPASPSRLTERPSIVGQSIILDDEDLTDTARYVGCYAVLDSHLGLSFKGLKMPIKFRAQGLIDPYEAQPGTFQPLKASRALVNRMQAIIWVWSNWQQLIRLEQDRDASDATLLVRRAEFNRVYDAFVTKHGTIAANANLLFFEGMQDPRLTALRSLEQDGQKAPIFGTRTHFPKRDLSGKRYEEVSDEHLAAALTLSLAEYGEVKAGAIAVWFGITPEQAEAALIESGLCCLEPIFPEAQGHRSFIAEIDEYMEPPQEKAKTTENRHN